MKKISTPLIVFFGFVALATVIITVSIGFLQPANKLMEREKIKLQDGTFVKISNFPVNHGELFTYPSSYEFGKAENAYQLFVLVRLPKELGGDKNDISSFRAYSAVALESHCLVKHWPQEGRNTVLQEPCHNGVYRIKDGLLIGVEPLYDNLFNALPYLALSTDEQGYIYVDPPTWAPDKNGVVGIGRSVTPDLYKNTAAAELNDYLSKSGSKLEIPLELSDGSILTPGQTNHDFMYKNPKDARIYRMIELSYCNCSDKALGYQSYKKWKLGDDTIYTIGQENTDNKYSYYTVIFFKNGYMITLGTLNNLQQSLSVVLDNFYPNKNASMLEPA
jgi:hypothetical protein